LIPDLYHLAFPKDPLRNKILVYTVFVLEVLQTCIITDSAFRVFGFGYGDISFFNDIGIAWFSVPIITGLGMYTYTLTSDRNCCLFRGTKHSGVYCSWILRLPDQRPRPIAVGSRGYPSRTLFSDIISSFLLMRDRSIARICTASRRNCCGRGP